MLSSNPALFVFLGVFAVGALFFALGSYLIRMQQGEAPLRQAQGDTRQAPGDTGVAAAAVGAEPSGVTLSLSKGPLELRLDYVERLAIVGAPWCIDELETLRASDPDARVREAVDAAIIVIRSRGY